MCSIAPVTFLVTSIGSPAAAAAASAAATRPDGSARTTSASGRGGGPSGAPRSVARRRAHPSASSSGAPMLWHTKEPWSASSSGRRGEPSAAVESGSNQTLTLEPAPTKQRKACHARADMISTAQGTPSRKKTTAMKLTRPSA